MSESLSIPAAPHRPVSGMNLRDLEFVPDSERVLPPGWWLLPGVILGAGMWVGLAILIL